MDIYWDILTEGFNDVRCLECLGINPENSTMWFTRLDEMYDIIEGDRIISRVRYESHKILRDIPLYEVIYG